MDRSCRSSLAHALTRRTDRLATALLASGALLDVRPFVLEPDRAVEQHRLARIMGEITKALELHDLTRRGVGQCGLDDRVGDELARIAVEVVQRIVGRGAGYLGGEQPIVEGN